MTTMKSYDAMAIRIMLGAGSKVERQAKLTKLAAEAKARIENRVECPECGSHGPHEDNGCSGRDLSYLCTSCGYTFDAAD